MTASSQSSLRQVSQRIAVILLLGFVPCPQPNVAYAKPLSGDPREQADELPNEIATVKTVTPRILRPYLLNRFHSHPRLKSVRAKDSRTIELKHVDGRVFLIALDNLLDRMNQNPAHRARDVQNMMSMNLRLIDEDTSKLTPEQFAGSLRLSVKDVSYQRMLTKQISANPKNRPHLVKPLVGCGRYGANYSRRSVAASDTTIVFS